MSVDDDDKPTVVLDLNALKKQKLKQEEELASLVQGLEFAVGADEVPQEKPIEQKPQTQTKTPAPVSAAPQASKNFTVILFDFQSDFFAKAVSKFPQGYNYQVATTLDELNKFLAQKQFQICVFNYDVNAKAVNQLTSQIKRKFPHTKTMIMARAISPEKAKIHQATASGANGYYQFPLDSKKIEAEFLKIQGSKSKVS